MYKCIFRMGIDCKVLSINEQGCTLSNRIDQEKNSYEWGVFRLWGPVQ